MRSLFFLAFTCVLHFEVGNPFTVRPKATMRQTTPSEFTLVSRSKGVLLSVPDDESTTTKMETISATISPIHVTSEPEGTSFPIDVPSPILLSLSMILAIIGTGSAFDLAGGSPKLGFGQTAAVAAIVIPLCLFLFYASILKATAETEADDKEFMKGKY